MQRRFRRVSHTSQNEESYSGTYSRTMLFEMAEGERHRLGDDAPGQSAAAWKRLELLLARASANALRAPFGQLTCLIVGRSVSPRQLPDGQEIPNQRRIAMETHIARWSYWLGLLCAAVAMLWRVLVTLSLGLSPHSPSVGIRWRI